MVDHRPLPFNSRRLPNRRRLPLTCRRLPSNSRGGGVHPATPPAQHAPPLTPDTIWRPATFRRPPPKKRLTAALCTLWDADVSDLCMRWTR